MQKLTKGEIEKGLSVLSSWDIKDGKLHRQFKFSDFKEAFRFMTAVAAVAERLQHHPEWTNVYNKVDVYLTTHDAGGITEKDFILAGEMDKLSR